MAMQIDKSIIMGELLSKAPGTADILQEEGMGCIFCPCVDVDKLVAKLNAYLATLD